MRVGVDIDPTSRNIRRYKHASVTVAKTAQGRFTLWLTTIGVNAIDAVIARFENV
jgi:hypothetical protein